MDLATKLESKKIQNPIKRCKEELTNIDKKSKEAIRNKALSDHLIKTAEDQKNELLMLMLDPLFADNWKITIQGKEITKPAITINKN